MNCEECKDLINVFMDNDLDESRAMNVRSHLGVCPECSRMLEELTSIIDVCSNEISAELLPPNSQALWCRINNLIESENSVEEPLPEAPRRRFWQLSFPQLAAALLCIAVVSSLLTVVAIRNYTQPVDADLTTRSAASQTTFEKLLSKVGLAETPQQARDRRLKEQQAAIDYWNARVQARRTQWDRATREAFDRNLRVIDDSVDEYTMILSRDPDDDLSGEMLDSVLNDKMNLLRDFSDL